MIFLNTHTQNASMETRNEKRKRITRKRIMNAAVKVFHEKGYTGTTIQDIMEKADLGYGTFYKHFNSKKEILQELMHDISKKMRNYPEPTSRSIFNRIYASNVHNYTVFHDNKKVLKILRDYYRTDEDLKVMWESLTSERIEVLRNRLHMAAQKGICRDINPDIATTLLWGMLNAGIDYVLDNDLSNEEIAKFAGNVTELLTKAIFTVDEIPHDLT